MFPTNLTSDVWGGRGTKEGTGRTRGGGCRTSSSFCCRSLASSPPLAEEVSAGRACRRSNSEEWGGEGWEVSWRMRILERFLLQQVMGDYCGDF